MSCIAGACSQKVPTCSGSLTAATDTPPLLHSQESVVSSENIFADDGRNTDNSFNPRCAVVVLKSVCTC